MDIIRPSMYQAIVRWLCWWQYQPNDERELELFHKAYQRFFWSTICSMVITLTVLEVYLTQALSLPSWSLLEYMRFSEIWLITGYVLAALVGATAFHKQDITFKTQHRLVPAALLIFLAIDVIIFAIIWLM